MKNLTLQKSDRLFKFCLPDIAAGRIFPQLAKVFQEEAPNIQISSVSTSKEIWRN
ncbi:MAG: hypothetical protein CM15mP109_08920 [Candidatus Dadabacteria bacterium]|nr:MAG: hypothetical protein CM15mP109_08920 [Candidatus Dadabacteria bacterium]